LVRDVANAIKNIVMAAYTKIKEIINGLINQLKKLPDLIKEAANWTGILDTISKVLTRIANIFKGSKMIQWMNEMITKIKITKVGKVARWLGIVAIIIDNIQFLLKFIPALAYLIEGVRLNNNWGAFIPVYMAAVKIFEQMCVNLFAVAAVIGPTVGTAGALAIIIPILWNIGTYLAANYLCPWLAKVFGRDLRYVIKNVLLDGRGMIMRPFFNVTVKGKLQKESGDKNCTCTLNLVIKNEGDLPAKNTTVRITVNGAVKVEGDIVGEGSKNVIRSSNKWVGDNKITKEYPFTFPASNSNQRITVEIKDTDGFYYDPTKEKKDIPKASARGSVDITCRRCDEYDEHNATFDNLTVEDIKKLKEYEYLFREPAPDDNVILGDRVLNVTDIDHKSKLAVLEGGYSPELQVVLYEQGVRTKSIALEETQLHELNQYDMLFIASGGLSSFTDAHGSSPIAKLKLERYVEQGGTIVAFSQQYGYNWDVLPGNVTGIGYQQDQACLVASLFMGKYSPIFASQPDTFLDANVDGFFLSYPSNTEVLLYRLKNDQPAMITYKYGKGRVVASTLYPGFATTFGQNTEEELVVLRELIPWLRNPGMENFEVDEGIEYDIPVQVMNRSYFVVSDPEGKVIEVLNASAALEMDGRNEVGIYHVDFVGMDAGFTRLETVRDISSFAISRLNESHNVLAVEGVDLTVVTDKETYVLGEEISGHVYVFNRKDTTYSARLQAGVVNWWLWHPGDDWKSCSKLVYLDEDITVGPNSYRVFNYTFTPRTKWEWRLFARLLEDGKEVAICCREVALMDSYAITPHIDVGFVDSGHEYVCRYPRNSDFIVQVSYSRYDRTTRNFRFDVKLEFFNPITSKWEEVGRDSVRLSLGSGKGKIHFDFGKQESYGRYRAIVEIIWLNTVIKTVVKDIWYLPEKPTEMPKIKVEMPSTLDFGKNATFLFNVTNPDPEMGLKGAVLHLELRKSGIPYWKKAAALNIPANTTSSLNIEIPFDAQPGFDWWWLDYSIVLGGFTLAFGWQHLSNYIYVHPMVDRYSYFVWEEMTLVIDLENRGMFNHTIDLSVEIAGPDYYHNESLSLNPGETR
ncbi:MAG: hypothetical protein KAU14_10405, partial [Thermoplasmata archaeon]|nr:hypothetical protein [Thermoplasmata archaeon]